METIQQVIKKLIQKYRSKVVWSTKPYVDEIISTMDSDDLDKLGMNSSGEYLNYEDCGFIVKRVLLFDNNIPVAFFDILDDDTQYNIAIGTRSDIKYRNKFYASNAAEQGMKFYKKYKRLFNKKVIWGVRVDNIASIKIAESLGFIKDSNSYSDDNKWISYVYE